MAMGQIGKALKVTRAALIAERTERNARMFMSKFQMMDGDYVSYRIKKGPIRTGRIIAVDDCWHNAGGGCTATITVMPLLESGRIGSTHRIDIEVGPKNKKPTGVINCTHFECIRSGVAFRDE